MLLKSKNAKIIFAQTLIWTVFIVTLWLVVLRSYGPRWEFVPSDLADGRFNNYILEHFFKWVSGGVPTYWSAPFFYPFKNVLTFSDTLLGAAPFYALFRWVGLDRETAFQAWYVLGFGLNYLAVIYVLSKLDFHPLAASAGAIFFAFGLPILAQETHVQLLYRFGVPLACFSLTQFFQEAKIKWLIGAIFWLVWQFYLSIYLGVFLSLLLIVLGLLLPFSTPALSFSQRLTSWPRCLAQAWKQASRVEKILTGLALLGLGGLLLLLLWPYYTGARHYGLFRPWSEVGKPQLEHYLTADGSRFWTDLKSKFAAFSPATTEQQLFPGMTISCLLILALVARFRSPNAPTLWLHLGATLTLMLLTLEFANGFSFYRLLWNLPGLKSIRAVGRVQLVLMWPLALCAAWVLDEILRRAQGKLRWLAILPVLLTGLLIAESTFFPHVTYPKALGQARLAELRTQLPANLPDSPVLYFATQRSEHYILQELDAMLVAQELGYPTLNGYSGNVPPGYEVAAYCFNIPKRIGTYMKFENVQIKGYYLETIQHIVPIGFDDCDPTWWQGWPW
jgi:hypothetical protein